MSPPDYHACEVTETGWLSEQVGRGMSPTEAVGRLLDYAVGIGASDVFV